MTSFSVTRWRSETSRKARIVVGSSAEGSQQPSIERKKRRLNAHVETDVAAENEDAAVAAEVRKTNSDERMSSERICANDFHQKRKVRNCAKFDRIRKTPSLKMKKGRAGGCRVTSRDVTCACTVGFVE